MRTKPITFPCKIKSRVGKEKATLTVSIGSVSSIKDNVQSAGYHFKVPTFKLEGYYELYFKSTTLDKEIGWTWKDMDKAYWDTWIPKKSDIKIITRLNKEQKKQALDELWEDLQGAIQFTRDRNNARRRQKRLAQVNKT